MIPFLQKMIRPFPVFANAAEGVHPGLITRTLQSAVTARHLLAKPGATPSEVTVCTASDCPLGVMSDVGEPGDAININLLGATPSTVLMVASEPLSVGQAVYTAANGKVQNEPAQVGTYYQVGHAITAAGSDGDLLEIDPCSPRKTVVTEPLSGVPANDTLALAAALSQSPDKTIVLPNM